MKKEVQGLASESLGTELSHGKRWQLSFNRTVDRGPSGRSVRSSLISLTAWKDLTVTLGKVRRVDGLAKLDNLLISFLGEEREFADVEEAEEAVEQKVFAELGDLIEQPVVVREV